MLKNRIICLCFFSLLLVIPTQIVIATTSVANPMEDKTTTETLTKNEKVESKATIGFSTRVENKPSMDLDKPISELPITGERLENSLSNFGLLVVISCFVYMYIKKKKKNKESN